MSLTLPNAKKLLRQIVGNGQGFWTTVGMRFLALSSTKPVPNPTSDSYSSYNITEPSEASYERARISESFEAEATSETIEDAIVYSISNTSEIEDNLIKLGIMSGRNRNTHWYNDLTEIKYEYDYEPGYMGGFKGALAHKHWFGERCAEGCFIGLPGL